MPEAMLKTGFELVDYEPAHAIEILAGSATEPGLVLDDVTLEFLNEAAGKGPCMTGLFDGRPVSCGGIWILWPGTGEAWFLNVQNIGDYHIDPQIAKNWIYERIAEYKIRRLQSPLKSDFPAGELYAQWLGFKFEARLECYCRDGTDAFMYKIITKAP